MTLFPEAGQRHFCGAIQTYMPFCRQKLCPTHDAGAGKQKINSGYNQAEAIASGLASAMGIPVRTDILIRKKRTRTQTKLDIEGKTRNVAGAFKAGNCSPEEYRHIIIVDDVFTTGSTLFACFTALRTVFPPGVRISVATLGFVGGA